MAAGILGVNGTADSKRKFHLGSLKGEVARPLPFFFFFKGSGVNFWLIFVRRLEWFSLPFDNLSDEQYGHGS